MMNFHFGILTEVTILLLCLFGIVDAIAHFTKYRDGETFSAWCWWLERLPYGVGIVFHVLFAVAIIVLWTHIELRKP